MHTLLIWAQEHLWFWPVFVLRLSFSNISGIYIVCSYSFLIFLWPTANNQMKKKLCVGSLNAYKIKNQFLNIVWIIRNEFQRMQYSWILSDLHLICLEGTEFSNDPAILSLPQILWHKSVLFDGEQFESKLSSHQTDENLGWSTIFKWAIIIKAGSWIKFEFCNRYSN